jgi:hypothetical protein
MNGVIASYKPKNIIATPLKKTKPPAIAWVYLSIFFIGRNSIPRSTASTTASIVPIVTREKTIVTTTNPKVLSVAAGYIKIGIKGSHGPKTNIVNNTHGVRFGFFSVS